MNRKNREFTVQTTEDELVARFCTPGSPGADWMTATDVARGVSLESGYSLRGSSARDFGFALKKAGFSSRKLDGITRYSVKLVRSFGIDSTFSGVKSGVGSGVDHSESALNLSF